MGGLLERSDGSTTKSWAPALDIWETADELVYAFDLPGVDESTIEIEAQDDTLTVSARRERTSDSADEHYFRSERRHGTFSRSVGLPAGVDEATIRATYDAGVLELRVPKPQEPKPRKIPLNGSQRDIEAGARDS